MEREGEKKGTAGEFLTEQASRAEEARKDSPARPAPSWRAWVISIVVAVILSVTATLLLGGSFRLGGTVPAAGCGSGGDCCQPPENK
jgi:hypothetical protein